jgi:hypothetical protein
LDAPPPVDLLAVDFPAEDDLLAVDLFDEPDFAAVFEPEDLLPDDAADFAAGFAEADLLVDEEDLLDDDLPLDVLLPDAVDLPEFLLFVAIALSLKFFLQLTQEFLR